MEPAKKCRGANEVPDRKRKSNEALNCSPLRDARLKGKVTRFRLPAIPLREASLADLRTGFPSGNELCEPGCSPSGRAN